MSKLEQHRFRPGTTVLAVLLAASLACAFWSWRNAASWSSASANEANQSSQAPKRTEGDEEANDDEAAREEADSRQQQFVAWSQVSLIVPPATQEEAPSPPAEMRNVADAVSQFATVRSAMDDFARAEKLPLAERITALESLVKLLLTSDAPSLDEPRRAVALRLAAWRDVASSLRLTAQSQEAFEDADYALALDACREQAELAQKHASASAADAQSPGNLIADDRQILAAIEPAIQALHQASSELEAIPPAEDEQVDSRIQALEDWAARWSAADSSLLTVPAAAARGKLMLEDAEVEAARLRVRSLLGGDSEALPIDEWLQRALEAWRRHPQPSIRQTLLDGVRARLNQAVQQTPASGFPANLDQAIHAGNGKLALGYYSADKQPPNQFAFWDSPPDEANPPPPKRIVTTDLANQKLEKIQSPPEPAFIVAGVDEYNRQYAAVKDPARLLTRQAWVEFAQACEKLESDASRFREIASRKGVLPERFRGAYLKLSFRRQADVAQAVVRHFTQNGLETWGADSP